MPDSENNLYSKRYKGSIWRFHSAVTNNVCSFTEFVPINAKTTNQIPYFSVFVSNDKSPDLNGHLPSPRWHASMDESLQFAAALYEWNYLFMA